MSNGSSREETTKLHHSREVKDYTIFRTTWKSSIPARVCYCGKQYPSLAKKQGNLQQMPRLKCGDCEREAALPRPEQDLMAWITEKRNDGLAILPNMVRPKALELSKDPQYDIPAGQFKNHWCQRFMKRNNLSLCHKTMLAQCLPPDYEEKIVQFHQFVIRQRRVQILSPPSCCEHG